MADVGTQLREYLDATAPAVELQEIFLEPVGEPPVRPLHPRPVRRAMPGWVYAVAAAIVLVALVGGTAWLLRGGSAVEPTDQPEEQLDWTPMDSGAPVFGTGEEAADAGLLNLSAPVYEIRSDADGILTITGHTVDGTFSYTSADARDWQVGLEPPSGFGHFEPFRSMDDKQITVAQYAGRGGSAVVVSSDGQTWIDFPIAYGATSARAAFDYNGCGSEPAVMGDTVIYVECNYSWDHLYDVGVLQGTKREVCEVGLEGTLLTVWHCEGENEPDFSVTVDLESLDLSPAERIAALRPVSMLTVGGAASGEIVIDPTELPIRGHLSGIAVAGDRFVLTTFDQLADYLGIPQEGAHLYTSTDGLAWTEIEGPVGTLSLQIEDDVILAIVGDQAGEGTSLWSSPDGSAWAELADFGGRNVHFVDSGASGYVVTTQPGDHISGLPEPEVGWSADGADWVWQSLSEALGGQPGDWAWARATVGDGFLIILTRSSLASLGYDTMVGNEDELAPLLVPQWFIAQLG